MKKQKRRNEPTLAQLAERHGVSVRTIVRRKASGQLKALELEKKSIDDLRDLEELKAAIKTSFLGILAKYSAEFDRQGLDLSVISEKDKAVLGVQFLKALGELSK